MSFVLDASVTASWCFPDEQSAVADVAMDRLLADEALAPQLWLVEMRNILLVNERRGRIDAADADDFLRDLNRLPIRVRSDVDEHAVMEMGRQHGLTAYDATYLDLAVRADVPVATLDEALARAVKAAGLALVGS